jgi:hypothetical protein
VPNIKELKDKVFGEAHESAYLKVHLGPHVGFGGLMINN